MKLVLKEKKETNHIKLQKQTAKYSKINNINSVINSSKKTSTDNLISQSSIIKKNKQQRNISNINSLESQYSSITNIVQESNRSFCHEQGSRLMPSTKDISTDKESYGGKLVNTGRNRKESNESDEVNKLRGHSLSNKPSGTFLSSKIAMENRKKIYFNLKQKLNKSNEQISDREISNSQREVLPIVRTLENNPKSKILRNKKEVSKEKIIINHKNFLKEFDQNKKEKVNENSEYFEIQDNEKEIEMTSDEKLMYGNREPLGYKKIKILGKGGCGIVHLCKCIKNGKLYAVKQISKKNKSENSLSDARKEIEIIKGVFDSNIDADKYIIKLVENLEDNQDIWLIFEKAGKSLGSLMFKIKGEFHNNERIYSIKKGKFFQHLFENDMNFKNFLKKMLKTINFLNCGYGIVHCDIKPDNILIEYDQNQDINEELINFDSMKLIDFGSAFRLDNPDNFSSNTPEYIPPEVTEILEKKGTKEIYSFLKNLKSYPYAIDIWSLGVMILEILLSCPIWMSYKTKTCINGKVSFK